MISNLKFKIKNSQQGITLIEVIVVIFIITLFSSIVVSDFPKIQRNFALSRAAYKLAQDLKVAQDLGSSGVQIPDSLGHAITLIRGYGVYVYINPGTNSTQYIIYADVADPTKTPVVANEKYDDAITPQYCDKVESPTADCIISVIDISKESPDLFIGGLKNVNVNYTSINFNPPGPITKFDNTFPTTTEVGITLGLHSDLLAKRTVWINKSGLISVK